MRSHTAGEESSSCHQTCSESDRRITQESQQECPRLLDAGHNDRDGETFFCSDLRTSNQLPARAATPAVRGFSNDGLAKLEMIGLKRRHVAIILGDFNASQGNSGKDLNVDITTNLNRRS